MATTSQEDALLLVWNVAMFDAVPGKEFFEILQEVYESVDKNIYTLSSMIYGSDVFTSQYAGLDDAAKITKILDIFGESATSDAGVIASEYISTQLSAGESEGKIIEDILVFLTLPEIGTGTVFDNMQTTILNKAEVARYHTIEQERSTTDLATMQAIIENVDHESTSVDDAKESLQLSLTALVDSIVIPDGNYSYGGNVNVTLEFDDNIYLNGVDASITLTLGSVQKEASLYSYNENSLTFNYVVEDGYFSEDVDVGVLENSLVLGDDTTLVDVLGYDVNTAFSSTQNALAVISDTKAPEFTLSNAHYDAATNVLSIYGSGFETVLEYNEASSTDVSERVDFSKLIWDFNSDENSAHTTFFAIEDSNVTSAKILNDNTLSIVIDDASALESDENYGDLLGADSLDILTGFLQDTAENVSQEAASYDLILGIDRVVTGTSSADYLYGSNTMDTITGLEGDDVLVGLQGNDTLLGGDNSDTINGGSGIDMLTGGSGNDIFVFAQGDSQPIFATNFGIDVITDLSINNTNEDLIDIDVTVETINTSVSGNVNEQTFITNMNNLLSTSSQGFNTSLRGDVSASTVTVTGGDLAGKEYLVVDYDASDIFTSSDFIVDISGGTVLSLSVDSFI